MFPLTNQQLNDAISKLGIVNITTATIRQICALAAELEHVAQEDFVHLEIGNPGLPAQQVGVEAECEALRSGVANRYPDIAGIPQLKQAGKDFVKAFLDLDIRTNCVVPTVGSMQGSMSVMMLLKECDEKRDTMLFINPGFSAQRNQAKMLGMNIASFDIYEYRGKKLEAKLEEMLADNRIMGIIYSNPNNPAWTDLTEEELEIIGRMATKHDVIVVEDLAYMGMDFRKNFGEPYEAPYVPSVGKYTDNYILLISASKIFSYAGERISMVCMSPHVYDLKIPRLIEFFEMPTFGDSYIYGVLYVLSSGTAHSAQYAMAAMMKAAVEDKLDFVYDAREYGRRAAEVKRIFLDNGFHIIYAMDGDEPISDGFFFTAGYKDMDSDTIQLELMRYGVSSISLPSTGSEQNGVRVCVSVISTPEQMRMLESRLKAFNKDHEK